MSVPLEAPAEEIARLRRCLNDLISVVALPALWAGSEPEQIVRSLMDALLGMLRLSFVLVRLNGSGSEGSEAMMRVAENLDESAGMQEIGGVLSASFGAAPLAWPRSGRVKIGDADHAFASVRLGLSGEAGMLVAGAQRANFPEETERLILDVAANQAVIGLHQARFLGEQRAIASELDRRIAQRTRELATASEELQRSERESRLLVDSIPGLVALLSATGEVETVNRQVLEYFGQTLGELKGWGTNDTIHAEDLPHVIDVFSRSIGAGVPYEIVQRFRRADGTYRWFENKGFPLRDLSGRIFRWCVLLTDIEDRKLAEQELRDREYEARLLVNSIPGLVAVVKTTGEIESVSQPVVDYYGRSLDELKLWAQGDTIHPEDRSGLATALTSSMTTGDPVAFEARVRRFDGVYRWFEIRGQALRDPQGRTIRWYFLQTDVDERKRAEDALKNSERELKQILNTIPTLVWCNQKDGPNEFLTERWAEYTGVSTEESLGWGWQVAMHPDDLPLLMEKWKVMLITGEAGEIEVRLRRHDGVYRWFLIRAEPFHDEFGELLRWYGTSTDIEDRKRAEEELRRNQEFLAEAQRISLSGCFSWRVETDVVNFSEGAYRIYGFEPYTPVTTAMTWDRVHPEDRALVGDYVTRARGSGGDQDYEVRLLMPDGSVKYLHTTSKETRDASGRREYVGAVQDVTARHMAGEALNRARSELAHVTRVTSLSALTASIAHEINQPLSGIITNASTCLRMLNADPPNVDGARETARRTIRDGNRASDVITRLRAMFSKKELTLEALDLNDVAREVIALSSNDLQRNQVIIQSQLAENLPMVTGDRVQLQQVILNLLRNASDAMAEVQDRPRRLVMKTEYGDSGTVRLSVRDSGIGLHGQDLDKIFDSFFTTKRDGMGIGLSVSRSIIERHSGRLWAEPNDGPGATFGFAIPRAQEGRLRTATATRDL